MSEDVAEAVFQIIRHHIYPDVADAITNELVSGPLAPLLAAQAVVERVEAEVKSLEADCSDGFVPKGRGAEVVSSFRQAVTGRLRRALDGTP